MTPSLHAVLHGLLEREPSPAELDLVLRAALKVDGPGNLVAVVMTRTQARQCGRLLARHGTLTEDCLELVTRLDRA